MRTLRISLLIAVACLLLSQPGICPARQGKTFLEKIGVNRGICVVLGDTGCERALQLARQSELLIYLQLPRAEGVQAAREIADVAGLCGNRMFIEKGSLARLHLADNLADALIAIGQAASISEA